MYRLGALPVGTYDVVATLSGFTTVSKTGIVVSVWQTLDLNFDLKVAQVAENITVSGGTPLIETSSSSVGGVVDIGRIESLPLNGRQFANLAATIPGVGLGFHADPTKSTQYSPQIGGGNGRNVNYQIDGGDNNRRHRRRPPPAVPARSDRAVQSGDVALQGGVRPQQRRCDEHRDQERHEQSSRQRLHVFRDDSMNAQHGDRAPRERGQAELPPVSVRRIDGRSDRAQQDALLRRDRADAAGHVPGGQHARPVPGSRMARARRRIARTCSPARSARRCRRRIT